MVLDLPVEINMIMTLQVERIVRRVVIIFNVVEVVLVVVKGTDNVVFMVYMFGVVMCPVLINF